MWADKEASSCSWTSGETTSILTTDFFNDILGPLTEMKHLYLTPFLTRLGIYLKNNNNKKKKKNSLVRERMESSRTVLVVISSLLPWTNFLLSYIVLQKENNACACIPSWYSDSSLTSLLSSPLLCALVATRCCEYWTALKHRRKLWLLWWTGDL